MPASWPADRSGRPSAALPEPRRLHLFTTASNRRFDGIRYAPGDALVFGREDNGLENDEIQQCTHLLRIPSDDAYRSLNLAQAAMICMYELRTASTVAELPDEKSPPASAGHRKRLFEAWREAMLATGFMKEDKADHMMQGFARIFSRGVKTEDDANIMLGVARQSLWAAKHAPAADGDKDGSNG